MFWYIDGLQSERHTATLFVDTSIIYSAYGLCNTLYIVFFSTICELIDLRDRDIKNEI
jgi:hypothetical protein